MTQTTQSAQNDFTKFVLGIILMSLMAGMGFVFTWQALSVASVPYPGVRTLVLGAVYAFGYILASMSYIRLWAKSV